MAQFFRHGVGAVFRLIPTKILTLETLGIPAVIKTFAQTKGGLVLVTGPTGSGKSTTLAALIDYINVNLARHIVTIEEPIEFVHANTPSRSVGGFRGVGEGGAIIGPPTLVNAIAVTIKIGPSVIAAQY